MWCFISNQINQIINKNTKIKNRITDVSSLIFIIKTIMSNKKKQSENIYYNRYKKRKKKKKYKTPGGLGWGYPASPGVSDSSAGFGGDGGGLGESIIREYIKQILETHSKSKCMEKGCNKPPQIECIWANGYAHAWFCKSHFNKWSTKGDGKNDVIKKREITGGQVGEKYGENG